MPTHQHEYHELTQLERLANMAEITHMLEQLFPQAPAHEIDEVSYSNDFLFARCDCGDYQLKLKGD